MGTYKSRTFIKELMPKLYEHYILISVLLYSVGNFVYINFSTTVGNFIQVIASLLFFFQLCKAKKTIPLKGFVAMMYTFLFIWSLILTFHMFFFSEKSVLDMTIKQGTMAVFNGNVFMPSMLVFYILGLSSKRKIDIPYFVRWMSVCLFIYLLLYPFAFHNMVTFDFNMHIHDGGGGYQDFITNSTIGISSFIPATIMIFWKKYLPLKKWILYLCVYLLALIMSLFMARRGTSAISILTLFLCGYMYLQYDNSAKLKKLSSIIIIFVLIIVAWNMFSKYSNSFFSLFMERLDVDSRSGVEGGFYRDMDDTQDWILGRGWLGTYFDPIFGMQRNSIETGYLALILRGGYLYLIPYCLVLLVSSLKGIFCSNSLFVKSFAILVLVSVIELYPYGWPTFNIKYFVVWMGVYVCNQRYFLEFTDKDIINIYFK